MNNRYDILQSISQGEDGTLSKENEDLVHIANVIARGATRGGANEAEPCSGTDNGGASLNEQEQRRAEQWAKQHDCWIPMGDIFQLGDPGPSGSESDTKDDIGKYHNDRYSVSDVLPKNVLKDTTGDFFVIDIEITNR